MNNILKIKSNKGNVPYTTPLKVKVMTVSPAEKYKKEGKDKSWTIMGLADVSSAVKAIVYDEEKLSSMKTGNSVMLRNYIYRDETIIITSATKMSLTGGIGEIPQHIKEDAMNVIPEEVTAPCRPLAEAKLLPVASFVSIKGKITKIDDVQQRNLQSGEQVPVRNIWIREKSVEGKITLWRNYTQLPLTVGSYVCVANVKTNNFRNETCFNSLSNTTITTEEAPADVEMLTVEGFTLQEVLLVCTDESGDIKDYLCARYLVEALFILDEEQDITTSMSNILPASVRAEIVPGTSEGSRINSLSLV